MLRFVPRFLFRTKFFEQCLKRFSAGHDQNIVFAMLGRQHLKKLVHILAGSFLKWNVQCLGNDCSGFLGAGCLD